MNSLDFGHDLHWIEKVNTRVKKLDVDHDLHESEKFRFWSRFTLE